MTIVDVLKRSDESGKIDTKIVEQLALTNQILWDAPYLESNSAHGNLTTRRSSLPSVDFRRINKGVATTKSTTDQLFQTSGFIEANSDVDVELVRLNGNTEDALDSENKPFIEAMNQKMATTVFYGDTATKPEAFDGFSKFYAALSSTTTNPGYNIINAGGSSTDNLSMWLTCWSPETMYLFYPKGTVAGLMKEYLGRIRVYDSNTNPYLAHSTNYKWYMGLAVKDWRYAVRLANIDISDLATFGSSSDTSPNLLNLMIDAKYRIPNMAGVTPVWYAPRTVMVGLEKMITNHPQAFITRQEIMNPISGRKEMELMIDGIPVRLADALVTETTAIQ
jgi:hypothetical protein